MRRTNAAIIAGTASLALAGSLVVAPTTATAKPANKSNSQGLVAVGLTADQEIVVFGVRNPRQVKVKGQVTGLEGDTRLVGIDYRVQNNRLYGVGDAGGIYVIGRATAVATKVGQVTVPLDGENFAVDFNPAADRLRIVSDTGQNLRHDVNEGGTTTVDGSLTYPPAVAPVAGVSAGAYTNNDLDPNTGTTLFDLDTALDQVAVQSPANSGTLAATGKLGADAGADAGFDIHSTLRDGKSVGSRAFAAMSVDGKYRLYQVSLLTGAATDRGAFPAALQVTDLALGLDQG